MSNNDLLSKHIKDLQNWTILRSQLQEELKVLQTKTPKSQNHIDKKLKQIRDLTQSLLDLSMYVAKQQPSDAIVNRKKWAVIFQIFEAEEYQMNGRIVSPTLALTVLAGWSKGQYPTEQMKEIQQ